MLKDINYKTDPGIIRHTREVPSCFFVDEENKRYAVDRFDKMRQPVNSHKHASNQQKTSSVAYYHENQKEKMLTVFCIVSLKMKSLHVNYMRKQFIVVLIMTKLVLITP